MKLGVVSDTHGNTDIIRKAVDCAGDVGHWLHAGDNYRDAVFLSEMSQTPVTAVAGNCDRNYVNLPQDEYLEMNGAVIWLTHGHRHSVKDTVEHLLWWGKRYEADVVVFGHTHIPFNEIREGILLFNPGSLGYSRGGNCHTFGVMTIFGKGNVCADIVEVE